MRKRYYWIEVQGVWERLDIPWQNNLSFVFVIPEHSEELWTENAWQSARVFESITLLQLESEPPLETP